MAENHEIVELTEMMEDRKSVQEDFSTMLGGVRDMLERKYLYKVHQAVDTERKITSGRPPREVMLMRALRSYASQDSYATIDQMIQLLMTMHTLKHMEHELQSAMPHGELAAMEDGADSLPPNPMARLLMTMALFDVI